MNARLVGYAFTYFGAVSIFTQLCCIGPMIKRLGERGTAYFGFAASTVGYGVLSIVHRPVWILLTGFLCTLRNGVGLSRSFHLPAQAGKTGPTLKMGAQGSNVINRLNVVQLNGLLNSPLFAQPVTADAGRKIEFNLSFAF